MDVLSLPAAYCVKEMKDTLCFNTSPDRKAANPFVYRPPFVVPASVPRVSMAVTLAPCPEQRFSEFAQHHR